MRGRRGQTVPVAARTRQFGLVGLVLAAAGGVLAVAPFRISIDLGASGHVRPRRRPPVVSAWERGPKDEVQLWAVTVGEKEHGFEVRGGQEPWCGDEARPRLALAGLLLATGAATTAVSRRRANAAPAEPGPS